MLLQRLLVRTRWLWISVLNVALTVISFCAAVALRFESLNVAQIIRELWEPLLVLCCCRLAAFSYFRLNQGYWRYVSVREAADVVESHLLSSLVFMGIMGISPLPYFSRLLIFLEFALSVLLGLGARLAVRVVCERYLLRDYPPAAVRPEAVVLGAGASGHFVIKTLREERRKPYRVIAVLDDNPRCQGMRVHGVSVVGPLSILESCLRQNPRISMVLLAIPSLSRSKRQKIEKICKELHVPFESYKSADNLVLDESADPAGQVPIDRILRRKTKISNQQEVAGALAGKRVLITGAGGSIGSELVRQVARNEPAELILVDKSEYNLYAIGQELSQEVCARVEVSYHLTDVANEARLTKLFENYQPQLVFHAAAYKHVPLLEKNGYEAFINNILGTFHMLRASKRAHVERFVLVSTDKAVEPSSTMGCTKRVCELMVQQVNDAASADAFPRGRDHQLQTAVVRFGNVINSAGSVIPLFKKQILTGRPITVTDEKVERYFMSIPEAASLILTAGILGHQGEIFMLDMGKPIKITEVAKKLRAIYGRRDVPIEIVGLRPGEKLSEELYYSNEETRAQTRFDKVFAVRSPKTRAASSVFNWAMEVAPSLNHLTDVQIATMLRSFTGSIQAKKEAESKTLEVSGSSRQGMVSSGVHS